MRIFRVINYLLLLGCLVLFSACALDNPETIGPPLNAEAIFTQAAQTVIAEVTEQASASADKQTIAAQTEIAQIDLAMQTIAVKLTADAQSTPTAPGVTATNPLVILTPTATPAPIPLPPPENCDRADLIEEPGNTSDAILYPGEVFRKSWLLQNVGTCTWTPDYSVVMVSGDFQGAEILRMPGYVRPGQTINLGFPLVAPSVPGPYIGYWNLRNPSGQLFGLGPYGEIPLTVQAYVSDLEEGFSYDFATNYCAADWRTGAGEISCQEFGDEERGLVVLMALPVLENGSHSGPAMWTHPNNSNNGWISGSYPPLLVRSSDRFKTQIGCLADSPGCDVIMQVEYELTNGTVQTLGQWREVFDGRITTINLDISPLAGQYVKFIFTVTVQNNQPQDANSVWIFPRIGP